MNGDRALSTLVVVLRPVNVEELQSDPARRTRRVLFNRARNPSIEHILAPSVGIEWAEARQVRLVETIQKTALAVAVRSGRGRLDEGDILGGAVRPDIDRQTYCCGQLRRRPSRPSSKSHKAVDLSAVGVEEG